MARTHRQAAPPTDIDVTVDGTRYTGWFQDAHDEGVPAWPTPARLTSASLSAERARAHLNGNSVPRLEPAASAAVQYQSSIQQTMPLTSGDRLAHYNVIALLGEGGLGQVWQATDTQLNRQVALKILVLLTSKWVEGMVGASMGCASI